MKWRLADFREATALFCALVLFAAGAIAAETAPFVVSTTSIRDEKAVFATVESLKVVPARVRINGTVAEVQVVEGDQVKAGQLIGSVGDEKLALQILALETRIAGLESQKNLAVTDLKRMAELFKKGSISQANLDSARTAVDVAQSALKTANAERDLIRRQLNEGAVLAPVSGRVLSVPITSGTVVMPGEVLATLAEENYILRLEIPERHARQMKLKDSVRIDGAALDKGVAAEGHISRIYPHIDNGRVYADAQVDGLGTYFVGQRIQVWIPAGERQGVVIPRNLVQTRAGIDWVRLASGKGQAMELPVQLGREQGGGVEVLSGLRAGDKLLAPAP